MASGSSSEPTPLVPVTVVPLTVVVLVGGRGRRFGGDKLSATIGTQTVLERCLAALRRLDAPLVVVGGAMRPPPLPAGAWLADAVPAGRQVDPRPRPAGDGPLAGLVAGLEAAGTPLVAVVAGDLPFPSAAVLSSLAARWRGEPAVVPRVGGRAQPLHAVWSTRHRVAVRAAFDGGERSPLRVAESLGARFVDDLPNPDSLGDDPVWVRDVDLREDLERLRRWRLRRGPEPSP